MNKEAIRIQKLPPYLFARIEQKIAEAKEQGIDVISLGIGDPDSPTADHIIEALVKEAHNPANHQYPSSVGMLSYRQAVADYYHNRFQVELDAKHEVVTLIGSKEGIANVNYCYIDAGDINLVPDPGYPVYSIGTLLAGGESYLMPLKEENDYIPDLKAIPAEIAQKAKLMFINYPNNPTGAIVREGFFAEVVDFAKKYDIIVCHDSSYSEITYDGYIAPSFLSTPGAKEVGIEFGSLSKPFNMTGWRIGWAAGRKDVIEAIGRYKSNVDSGAFQAVQYAGIAALNGDKACVKAVCDIYKERRDVVVAGLRSMGWKIAAPKGTFYIWVRVPKGYTSTSFAEIVLDKANVVITPGNGYGEYGEGYFRISLCIGVERIKEALARMQKELGIIEF
ncbi:MAG: LL-diaminopimelate aminotransferase [Clostridia bacterium]